MEKQRRKLFALVEAMNEALDKQRWRRLPALHQQHQEGVLAYSIVNLLSEKS
ncbi:TPA: hypothetical protein KEW44_002372 [Escherichia coli]|nr:hypothetical protein [Escherichia coli]HBC6277753.1 hypothetical protein [Escherichia coli]HCT9327175.1 hypothetical protein [Escherichia coli]